MVIRRALFVMLVLPMIVLAPAYAQTGGITVAPVLVTLEPGRNITSIRLRNNRARPVSFEIEANSWRQEFGRDILTPTNELLVAPGVFEVAANSEQVIRLGVQAFDGATEQAYRIIIRELPSAPREGTSVGFRLEMSLPVFIAPTGAEGHLDARTETTPDGPMLVLSNSGRAHVQISSLAAAAQNVQGPRYLLAGASTSVPLPAPAQSVRILAVQNGRTQVERVVHVEQSPRVLSLR